ncbi:DUF2057 family protein [Halopseudomonas salegens]|uniref:DUF2057 domain-containing protein n=1 Tax=Halopseudomonas salegens TaxID=1434072 RepID=A0A1H2F6T2_9GAMM|nr:DUF2057 family protein [Halopseudomonas salegens]SDU03071.1 hypothetical protein SAMN05216210_1332 [Halopseudomonas salegens]
MRALFCIFLAVFLTACAQQSNVRLYPGNEQASSNLLTVKIPQDLEVTSINGQRVPAANRLIGGQQALELLPGDYEIVLMYKRVFDIGGGISHEVIRSRQAIINLSGSAGDAWMLQYTQPESLEQARELRSRFEVTAINQRDGERVASRSGDRPTSALAQLIGMESSSDDADNVVMPLQANTQPNTPVARPAVSQPSTQAQPAATLPATDATLTTLQQLWLLLTPESRQQFLDWAQ